MPAIPEVTDHEVDEQWRSIEAFYERNGTLVLPGQGTDLLQRAARDRPRSFDDYSDDEFVAMYLQVLVTRPDPELDMLRHKHAWRHRKVHGTGPSIVHP